MYTPSGVHGARRTARRGADWLVGMVLLVLLGSHASRSHAHTIQQCWYASDGSGSYSCWDHHPAQYTTGAAGDVALSNTNQTLRPITDAMGMINGHAAALYDNSGDTFTESFWDASFPPKSQDTGEPHACGRPVSPYYAARLSPGSLTAYVEDAVPGTLVKAMANPYCSIPSEKYHFSSFLNLPTQDCTQTCVDWNCYYDYDYNWVCDCNSYSTSCTTNTIRGGSCVNVLTDFCGTPVDNSQDKQPITDPSLTWNALNAVWTKAHDACMGTVDYPWYKAWICHADKSEECGRAAYQLVNEILYKGNDYDDGWSERCDDAGCSGALLGDAKDTGQTYFTNQIGGNGAVNGGGCAYAVYGYNGAPPIWDCPGWLKTGPGLNMPDVIANAANRICTANNNCTCSPTSPPCGQGAPTPVSVGSGIAGAYDDNYTGCNCDPYGGGCFCY
jgi:hypothetical protein